MVASEDIFMDIRVDQSILQSFRYQEVVDPPTCIVFAGVEAVTPPGISAFRIRMEVAESIDESVRDHIAELGAFLVRKARVFAVRFPILQIDVFVGNVEVTADNDRFFCLQALQKSQKGRFPKHPVVQPLQLLL